MAAPNIVGVTTITAKSAGLAVTTSATNIVNNAASSGKVLKINSLIISNVDGTNNANITVYLYKNQSITYYIAKEITVPAKTSLQVITKDAMLYLEENDSIRLLASATGDLQGVISYEEIS